MGMVEDSLRRVALLEAALEEDRRAVVRAASVLAAHAIGYLARPGALAICYAAGTLAGASAADMGRQVMRLVRETAASADQSAALRR